MHGSLRYEDFQLFMKRLRRKIGPVRFFMCGEYGENFDRPHFHALLFGYSFPDAKRVYSDAGLSRSETLEKLWPHGFATVGEVTYASARYVASYCVKKVTGTAAEEHYRRVDPYTGEIVPIEPEFCHMSLKPGIGLRWLAKYWKEVYLSGHHAVMINGTKKRVPRYFDKKMDEIVPLLMDDVEFQRALHAQNYREDQTPERLEVRERVERARLKFNTTRNTKVSL